jgi:hypothetical protein
MGLAALIPVTSAAVALAAEPTGGAPDESAKARTTSALTLAERTRTNLRRGQLFDAAGYLRPGARGRKVSLQMRRGGAWRTIVRDRTGRGGHFYVAWRPATAGSYKLRLRFAGDETRRPARRRLGGRVRVYRPAHASWYGPGLYGNRLACGGRLRPGTLGVANKHLPCGTMVTFRHGGRSVTVPVVDRGPYVGGREWDLTAATRRALRFRSTGTVWATR